MDLGVTAVMLPELEFDEQVELCRSLGVRYYQYRPRIIADNQRDAAYSNWGNHKFDLTPDRLAREGAALTRRLRDAGLEPCGTVPSANADAADDELKLHFEGAAVAEAGAVRVAPPPYPKEPFDYGELLKRTVGRYARIIERLSDPLGIKIILETHNACLVASPALALNVCREFSPKQIGVIFDIANFSIEGELRPVMAVSVLRDYIHCVHIGGGRRVISDVDALGCKRLRSQMCAMEESDLHLPTWVNALHEAELEPPLIIEDFTPNMTGADRLTRSATFLHKVLESL